MFIELLIWPSIPGAVTTVPEAWADAAAEARSESSSRSSIDVRSAPVLWMVSG